MLSHDFYGMFINSNGLTAKLWNVQARFISDPVTWIIFNVPIVYLKYCFLCSASGCWETGNLLQKIWTKASTQTAHCSRPSWRILWSSWVWPIQRLCWVQADLFRTLEFSLWNANDEFVSRLCVQHLKTCWRILWTAPSGWTTQRPVLSCFKYPESSRPSIAHRPSGDKPLCSSKRVWRWQLVHM